MQMNHKYLPLVAIALLLLTVPTKSMTDEEFIAQTKLFYDDTGKVCWKGAYGRGAGEFPDHCLGGKSVQAGLCYTPCKPSFNGNGPVCWEKCAEGASDAGLFCINKKAGFPTSTITKNSYPRGAGHAPDGCPGALQNNAGLCYPSCKPDYTGVGPVCWKNCSGDIPTDCGALCGSNPMTCAKKIYKMVKSVGEMVVNIAGIVGSGGTSLIGKTAAKELVWKATMSIANEFKGKKLGKKAFVSFMGSKAEKLGVKVSNEGIEAAYDESEQPEGNALDKLRKYDPIGAIDVILAFKQDIC
jgi:hypothetical protein